MKYAPKKVFIKENNIYIEITNEEHEARKATDKQYAKRWFIPMHGMLMEVEEDFYKDFYRQKERDDYLSWRAKNKDISYNDYDTEEGAFSVGLRLILDNRISAHFLPSFCCSVRNEPR